MTLFRQTLPLIALALGAALFLFLLAPIPQDPAYHDFADPRGWLGIANFGDVMSNLPFILVGLCGMGWVYRHRDDTAHFTDHREALTALLTCFGFFLVGFGSGYYHLSPGNETLVWDRLPMTIGFMAFFSLMIMERLSLGLGWRLLPVLLAFGLFSVWYWNMTEQTGHGDLRPYVFVQFFPMLAIPLMLWRYKPRYSGVNYLGWAVFWYVTAKLLEHFDQAIFSILSGIVSGHCLKHLAAAGATWCIVLYFMRRKSLAD